MGLIRWLREAIGGQSKAVSIRSSEIEDDDEAQDAHHPGKRRRKLWRLTEQIVGFSNPDEGTEEDDRFFISLEKAAALDLPPRQQQRSQRLANLLWRKNVRAFSGIEILKDFVLGDGIAFHAEDKDVQKLLDEHWFVNQWEDRSPERLRMLYIMGEQLYPAFGDQKTGIIRLSSVLPLRILRVNRDADNAEELVSVSVTTGREHFPSATEVVGTSFDEIKTTDFQIIRPGDHHRYLFEPDGEWAFFFAINRLSGATRGASDLLSAIDWLEGVDGAVFSLLERLDIVQDIVYDILYKNLNDEEIRRKVGEFAAALRSGGIYGHNENVELTIKSPELGSSEAKEAIDILQDQISAGLRLPPIFFGKGAGLNRATAQELSLPVSKMIQGKQKFFRRMLSLIFDVQIQFAKAVGRIPKDASTAYEIEMPQVFLRDMRVITASLVSLASALASALREKWITLEDAAKTFQMALEQLGSLGRTTRIDRVKRAMQAGQPEEIKKAVEKAVEEVTDNDVQKR